MGHRGKRQPWNHAHVCGGEDTRPHEEMHMSLVRTGTAGAQLRDPLKTRPCLDSITAKVFYFLEHLDQRTLF